MGTWGLKLMVLRVNDTKIMFILHWVAKITQF